MKEAVPYRSESLAVRAREGDPQAWRVLWEHLRPQVYARTKGLTSGIPGMEREDIEGWLMGEVWRLLWLHDPSRARLNTFVIHGVRRSLLNLRRDLSTPSRLLLKEAVRPSEEGDPMEVPDEKSLRPHEKIERWADLDRLLAGRDLCPHTEALVNAIRSHPDASFGDAVREAGLSQEKAQAVVRSLSRPGRERRNARRTSAVGTMRHEQKSEVGW